jgi:Ca-activated chloride channel family protein
MSVSRAKWPAIAAAASDGWLWLLPILAGALMIVGLARPQRAHSRTEVTANGIDIVLALDVSGSMQALDFAIDNQRVNRIEVVKSVVAKFIDERPNDRIGMIAFAGAPYLVSPITLDHDWLQQNLERVNIGAGDDGTAIGSAIAAGVNRLRTTPAKSKVVILLTDGMNNTGKISPSPRRRQPGPWASRYIPSGSACAAKRRFRSGTKPAMHVIMATVDVDEKTLQAVADETGGAILPGDRHGFAAKDLRADQSLRENGADRAEVRAHEELYSWALIPRSAILGLGRAAAHSISEAAVSFSNPGGCRRDCCLPRAHLDVAPLRCRQRRSREVRLGASASCS